MKILSIISILFSNLFIPNVYASEPIEWYGQILEQNVYIYRTPTDEIQNNVYFIIEPTYFVKLIGNANNVFYVAQYMDIDCYVRKCDVQVVKNPLQKKYLTDITFRVFTPISQTIRTFPNSKSTALYTIPIYSKNVTYYGKIYGEESIEDRTNLWYFCKFSAEKEYMGYVYADGCDKLSTINKISGEFQYVDSPIFTINNISDKQVIKTNSNSFKYIVLFLTIPAVLFLVMFFKSNKILKLDKKEKAKEVKPFFDS